MPTRLVERFDFAGPHAVAILGYIELELAVGQLPATPNLDLALVNDKILATVGRGETELLRRSESFDRYRCHTWSPSLHAPTMRADFLGNLATAFDLCVTLASAPRLYQEGRGDPLR
ncbi:MAG TPA: hypothetical protein VE197_00410 [Mycobacterium sp.]|nr:hypothetical protein [Mycobacterium sp.]